MSWERVALSVLLVYFALRLGYFAFALDAFVPPDEATHLGRVETYSAVPLIPVDGPNSYEYGLVSQRPFLYYLTLGKLLHLNVFPLSDLLFLRLVNGLMGLLTVVYGIRWIRLLSQDASVRVLFALLLTNLLMFTGLSASVSYDNLVNLLAAAALFYFCRFFRDRSFESFLLLVLCILAGCLTKQTFLPLAGIFGLLFIAREKGRIFALPSWLIASLRPVHPLRAGGVVLAAALLAASLSLYGTSLIRYGRLVPSVDQIVGLENAMKYRVFSLYYLPREYREGNLGYEEAEALARQIEHEGDRLSALFLLQSTRDVGDERMGVLRYAWTWGNLMLQRGVGYYGHRTLLKGSAEHLLYLLILLIAALAPLSGRAPKTERIELASAAFTVLAYCGVLFWFVNRAIYLETGLVDFGVQGRYLFPVLVPLCGIIASSLLRPALPAVRVPLAVAVAAFVLYGDFPFFWLHATPEWFSAAGP